MAWTFWPATLYAESIRFDNPQQSVVVAWDQKDVAIPYHFTNVGAYPVVITEVHSSCGCLASKPDQDVIQPGGSGTINAKFIVGHRVGRINKSIYVKTNEPNRDAYELKLLLDIPVVMSLTPALLYWDTGDPLAVKTASIALGGDYPLTITSVEAPERVVKVDWMPDASGRSGVITVVPISTNSPWNAVATIRCSGNRDFLLYLRCLPKSHASTVPMPAVVGVPPNPAGATQGARPETTPPPQVAISSSPQPTAPLLPIPHVVIDD